MKFRFRAFAFHLLASASALGLVLGFLYLGWYRWPGWYLAGAASIAVVMILVDVGLGPLTTLIIANPKKPRAEFRRDLTIIVLIQAVALACGAWTLWNGRPLYYTFSLDRIEIVQASSIDDKEIERARVENPLFSPRWYSTPKWVWVPLPSVREERDKVIATAILEGRDVIVTPWRYRLWEEGRQELRAQLRPIAALSGLSEEEGSRLATSLRESGIAGDVDGILCYGRMGRAVAFFNRANLALEAIVPIDSPL